MREFRNAAFGLIAAATVAAASDVYELKQDTFAPFIKEHDLVLAECKLSLQSKSDYSGIC